MWGGSSTTAGPGRKRLQPSAQTPAPRTHAAAPTQVGGRPAAPPPPNELRLGAECGPVFLREQVATSTGTQTVNALVRRQAVYFHY